MATLEEMDVQLALEALVTVNEDHVPYILEWPDLSQMDGNAEATVLVVLKRQAGFLLAIPQGFIPDDLLARANRGEDAGPIGASTVLQLPGVLVEDGRQSQIGSDMNVLVVDVDAGLAQRLRAQTESEEIAFLFDAENPFAIPSPSALLQHAMEWVENAGAESGLAFYSADGQVEELEDVDGEGTPLSRRSTPPPKPRKPKPETSTRGEKPKRPTTASLAASLDSLLQLVPNLSSQMQDLSERQRQLEVKLKTPARASTFGLSQPLAATVAPASISSGAMAKVVATPPPKTRMSSSAGMLQGALFNQPADLLSLEEEKGVQSSLAGDSLARADLAQSQALTTLVGQIASNTSDPLMDLSSGVGPTASTRGAVGRNRLQAELASHSGSFYVSVLKAMARRMQPTTPASGTPLELLEKGICGTRYMERFGGYGRQRDLGLILYQIMGIMDFLQSENIGAVKDGLALLAVALDQAVMDGGKFDLASLLTLQEEPPASIYVNRQASSLSRAKAFSPLADQKWITVALAFVKELDVITAKRQEMSVGGGNPKALGSSSEAGPKAKPAPKKKGKGGGKGNQGVSQAVQEVEEDH